MGIWDISKKQLNLNFSWEAIRFKLDKKLLEVYTIYPYLIIQKQKSKDNGKEVQIKNKLKYHINDQIKLILLQIFMREKFGKYDESEVFEEIQTIILNLKINQQFIHIRVEIDQKLSEFILQLKQDQQYKLTNQTYGFYSPDR